jgi:hypothetical protein
VELSDAHGFTVTHRIPTNEESGDIVSESGAELMRVEPNKVSGTVGCTWLHGPPRNTFSGLGESAEFQKQ